VLSKVAILKYGNKVKGSVTLCMPRRHVGKWKYSPAYF